MFLIAGAHFHQRDGLNSGYPDGSFDALWAVESLMHFPDRAAFFAVNEGGSARVAAAVREAGALALQTFRGQLKSEPVGVS